MSKQMKRIGWIGTGVMGKSMCKHLLNKGYSLSVFNRTKSKTDELVEAGAKYEDLKSIAKSSDCLFLMLGYPKDVESIAFESEEGGLLKHMRAGTYLVDHTTSSPALAMRMQKEFEKKNISCYDAPVSGGDIGAKNGQLVTMCGGDKAKFAEVEAIMRTYSKNVQLLGDAGSGQHTKMVNQIVIAGSMISMCEGLVYGHKAGLNLEQVLSVIGGGAAASFSLNTYTPRILQGNLDPGFYVEHFVKDMEIALDECRRMGIALPGLALVHQLYRGLMAQGGGKLGTQGLIKVLENLNGVKIK
jgi:3-hydroxyisobutyrate dehydrogenase